MFKGSCVALVTPMTPEGSVDEAKLTDLIEWHIDEGTRAIVIAGTTGESATLSPKEIASVTKLSVRVTQKRVPIIVGTGSNSTQKTIDDTLLAQQLGADAALVVTPYYNRPTQLGLLEHYQAIVKMTNLPLILYNVPTRTACDLLPETVAKLSKLTNIFGIKEATGDLTRLASLKALLGQDFMLYSGDDATCCDFMLQGGQGVISISSNVVPKKMAMLCDLALAKKSVEAKALDAQLSALHKMLVVEPNPIPVKWLMHHLNQMNGSLRLPLTSLSHQHFEPLTQAYQQAIA